MTLLGCGETALPPSLKGSGNPIATSVVPDQATGKSFLMVGEQLGNDRKIYRFLAVISRRPDDVFISATFERVGIQLKF